MNEEFIIKLVENCRGSLISEERGVGAPPDWLDAIKEITDWVASYIKDNSPGFDNKWHLRIPSRLSSLFRIFKRLNIDVNVEDIGSDANDISGNAEVDTFKFPDSKMNDIDPDTKYNINSPQVFYTKPVDMTINAVSNGDILNRVSLSYNLLHELNHKIDEYYRTVNSKQKIGDTFTQAHEYTAFKQMFGGENAYYHIIYRLFSESEQNALISSLYKELEEMDSSRNNFKKDLKECFAYKAYDWLRKCINAISQENNMRTWELLRDFFIQYPRLSPLPKTNLNNVSLTTFRNAFIKKSQRELEKLFRGLGRVASYYYDMHEESLTEISME